MKFKRLMKNSLIPAIAGFLKLKSKVELIPILDMKGTEEKWVSTGSDPAFLLEGKCFSGWNKLCWFANVSEFVQLKMYWDTGEGFSEAQSKTIVTMHPNISDYEQYIYIPERTVRLRFDPGEQETEFVMNSMYLSKITRVGMLISSFLKALKQRGGNPTAIKSILMKAIQLYKLQGLKGSWNKAKQLLGIESDGSVNDYQAWLYKNRLTDSDKENIKKNLKSLDYQPLISILLPVYNVEEIWLRKCIDSVINQYYENWELCIADDASPKSHIKPLLEDYMLKDSRIKVIFREINGHISECSNSALDLANGEFIGLLDHDDELSANALYENIVLLNRYPDADFIYSDEDKIDIEGNRHSPYFKPDWSPDLLLSNMYTCHFGLYRKTIVDKIGGFRKGYEGSQDYDLVLRLTEHTDKIHHIPKILYHWRTIAESTASGSHVKNYTHYAGKKALKDALSRRGIDGEVLDIENYSNMYYVHYNLKEQPLVSIIIPTRDMSELLDNCLKSIFEKSKYFNFEIVIVDNGSEEESTFKVFDKWVSRFPKKVNILRLDIPFNYSKLNNEAAGICNGDYLVLLNNDIEVISENWIEEMLGYAQQNRIGAVGVKLLYPDNTIQHSGVTMGLGGVAGHAFRTKSVSDPGYFGGLMVNRNCSVVTAACLMVRKDLYLDVQGLDERLSVAFNDVDFCLKLLNKGYSNVCLNQIKLYHHESKTRGTEDTVEKKARFMSEIDYMVAKWKSYIDVDPYYNQNLSLLSDKSYELKV